MALAARDLGVPATIVMPDDAPALKLAATRGYGAEVLLYDRRREDREAIARRLVEERGVVLVPPFDDDAIIAGQGTAALELLDEVPDLDVVVTPCGGAGLLAGTAVAATGCGPGSGVLGVEPEAGDDVARSLREGRRDRDRRPGDDRRLPPDDARRRAEPRDPAGAREGVVTVSDLELRQAMTFLFSRMKLVVEPGGAAAAAALFAGRVPGVAGRRVGVDPLRGERRPCPVRRAASRAFPPEAQRKNVTPRVIER